MNILNKTPVSLGLGTKTSSYIMMWVQISMLIREMLS